MNRTELLITVCRRCHPRIHRLEALRVWIPELLWALWAEQHPDRPAQQQFGWTG